MYLQIFGSNSCFLNMSVNLEIMFLLITSLKELLEENKFKCLKTIIAIEGKERKCTITISAGFGGMQCRGAML